MIVLSVPLRHQDGRASIHYAATMGYVHIIKYLVEVCGVSPTAVCTVGLLWYGANDG